MNKIGKIISGGQTGADRAALDAAIASNVPHGGWCPLGRLAQDGRIPDYYQLRETATTEYKERTRANVATAHATLIWSHGTLTGGSLLTQQFAVALDKPCLHVDLLEQQQNDNKLACFHSSVCPLTENLVLNVAGPRASTDPQIYEAVYQHMMHLLKNN